MKPAASQPTAAKAASRLKILLRNLEEVSGPSGPECGHHVVYAVGEGLDVAWVDGR